MNGIEPNSLIIEPIHEKIMPIFKKIEPIHLQIGPIQKWYREVALSISSLPILGHMNPANF